jgi:hypothetical protein
VYEKQKLLAFAGHTTRHSRGPGGHSLVPKAGHDFGHDLLARRPHLGTCMLLSSYWQLWVAISRILPSSELLNLLTAKAELTNSKNTQALLLLRLRVIVKFRMLTV